MLPTIRGQYEVQHEIGSGGMGKVYSARDNRLNRQVALKILLPDHSRDPERRRRFFLEAQAASALNHPNIITVYDIVSEEIGDVLVMEYVSGKTLVDLIPRGGLRVPQVINYGVQIADGLNAAHTAGIIHRDLKPGNVMVTDRGLVKILDFGLAKLTETPSMADPDATAHAPLTIEGTLIGTLCYMSPEQAQGKKIDARSDIFALGAVLYEMATGSRAFTGDNSVSMLSSVLRDEPRSVIEIAPDIPDELDRVIRRCLRKNPDDRWQSMAEVHRALSRLKQASDSGVLYRHTLPPSTDLPTIIGDTAPTVLTPRAEPVPAPAPAPVPQPPGSKTWIGLAAVIVLGVAGAGIWYATSRPKPVSPPPEPASAIVKPSPSGLTNESIIEMVTAKVPENVIVNQIRTSPTNFNMSAPEIIKLAKNGVSERIIETMRSPLREGAAPADAAPVAPPKQVAVREGTPVPLVLNEDVPSGVTAGTQLSFEVSSDVTSGDNVIAARGATATGIVLERTKKKFLGLGSKPMFGFVSVQAANGERIQIRATQQRPKDDEPSARVIESPGSKPKGVVAAKGAAFIAYVAADRTLTLAPPAPAKP